MIKTSYISKLSKIENDFDYFIYIIRVKPESLKENEKMLWFRNLGPSKSLLYSYKRNDIDYKRFSELYVKELKLYAIDDVRWIIKKHKEGKRICLLCYEKDPNVCHRKILGSIIEQVIKEKVDECKP